MKFLVSILIATASVSLAARFSTIEPRYIENPAYYAADRPLHNEFSDRELMPRLSRVNEIRNDELHDFDIMAELDEVMQDNLNMMPALSNAPSSKGFQEPSLNLMRPPPSQFQSKIQLSTNNFNSAPRSNNPFTQRQFFDQQVIRPQLIDQPMVEQRMIDTPIKVNRLMDQPVIQPIINQPIYRQHMIRQPIYQPRVIEQPVYVPRIVETPLVQQRLVQTVSTNAPIIEYVNDQDAQPIMGTREQGYQTVAQSKKNRLSSFAPPTSTMKQQPPMQSKSQSQYASMPNF